MSAVWLTKLESRLPVLDAPLNMELNLFMAEPSALAAGQSATWQSG